MAIKQLRDFIDPANRDPNAPLLYSPNPLRDLTSPESGLSDDDGVFVPDDASSSISDALGQLLYFTRLLNDTSSVDPIRKAEHEKAVAEWRGMLAEIFLTGMIGGKNSIRRVRVDRVTPSNNSSLYNIYLDRFSVQSEKTGFDALPKTDTEAQFLFYQKDNKPFAMVVPGIIILPFANYDHRIFAGSKWVDKNTLENGAPVWSNQEILSFFSRQGNKDITEKFIAYLREFVNNPRLRGNDAVGPLNAYIDDLRKFMGEDYEFPDSTIPQEATLEERLKFGYTARIDARLRAVFNGDFFETNLLCFKPYYEVNPDAGVMIENPGMAQADSFKNTWDSYCIDYGGKLLTPIALNGFCNETQPLYVVPPVNQGFLSALADPANGLQFVEWHAELLPASTKHEEIVISIQFSLHGQIMDPIVRQYPASTIFVSNSMPYISMWPFVKAVGKPGETDLQDWKEYFVSIHTRDFNESRLDRFDFPKVEAKLNEISADPMRRVDHLDQIQIDIFEGHAEEFQVNTNPFGESSDDDGSFITLKTEKFPRFLTIKVQMPGLSDPVPVGCWAINDALAIPLRKLNLTGILGFDFATTATVLALAVGQNHKPGFVPGPGKYLYDVFNPNWEASSKADDDNDRRETWEMLQTYYLFGCKTDECGKIYSYGQLNNASDENGKVASTTNNVTGRAVLVEPNYMKRSLDGQSGAASDIIPRIKWPTGAKVDRVHEAARNFILNCLTWGVLAARVAGCNTVEIHSSYALGKNNAEITRVLNDVLSKLQQITGMDDKLTVKSFTEAASNAKYLIEGQSFSWHQIPLPNPDNGFMITDIGGGTTDIAVCQFDAGDTEMAFNDKVKSEISFRYAGREIVDISLLRIKEFQKLWQVQKVDGEEHISADKLKEVLDAFNYNGPFDPEYVEQEGFKRATAFVGFLLDQATLKDAYKGIQAGQRMDIMKCKYLALCWALGRYVARLGEGGVISTEMLDNRHRFKIYLTGCAARGIQSFILSTVPDFLNKCGMIATMGYYSNVLKNKDGTPRPLVIDVSVLSQNNAPKQEIVFGLTELNEENNAGPGPEETPWPGGIDLGGIDDLGADDEPASQPEAKSSKPSLAPVEMDPELTKKYYKMIVKAICFLLNNPPVLPTYDEMMGKRGEEIDAFIENRAHRAKVYNASNIEGLPIVNELYALYTLEKYLDVWFSNETLK